MRLSVSEIEDRCNKFLEENYDMGLGIPIKINNRLSSTLGAYVLYVGESYIEFNGKFIRNGTLEEIEKVIKHECIHYALHMKGLPYYDGDDYFEEELVRHKVPSDESIYYRVERNVRVYECNCMEHIKFRTISNRMCVNCNGKLVYKEKRKMIV